jgi:hypothetical protein
MNEVEFKDELRKQYLAEGFEELNTTEIGKQLSSKYEPDLALKRGDEILIIEIKTSQSPASYEQLRQIKSLVESKRGWHFRFFVVPARQGKAEMSDALPQANTTFAMSQSFADSYPSVAIVTLWISFETAMRHLLSIRNERPATGTSGLAMARRLRDLGELDDDDLRKISELFELRNRAVHGYEVTARPSNEVLDLGKRLLKDAGIFEEQLSNQRFIQG